MRRSPQCKPAAKTHLFNSWAERAKPALARLSGLVNILIHKLTHKRGG